MQQETLEIASAFQQIVDERRSVRIYDTRVPVDDAAVKRSLERALLSPNSSNLQLWEFYRVRSTEVRRKLAHYCLDQKAASTAQELIVVVTRKDKWKERSRFVLEKAMENFPEQHGKKEKLVITYYERIIPFLYAADPLDIWGKIKNIITGVTGLFRPIAREVDAEDMRVVVHKSAALAAQTFMLSMKAEGYDSCPMEGFDSARVKKLLNLPRGAEVNMIIGVGKAAPGGVYGPRVRVPGNEVIFEL